MAGKYGSMKMPMGKSAKKKPVEEEMNEMDLELFGAPGDEEGMDEVAMQDEEMEEGEEGGAASALSDEDLLAEVKKRGLSLGSVEEDEMGEELA